MKLGTVKKNKTTIAISIIWLFHISACIGISIGFQDWFISKTPINIILFSFLFLIVYPLDTLKKFMVFTLFFSGGMFAEWLGTNYGILFGNYTYGVNLGPKLDGVPFLIGINWSVLTFVTASVASKLVKKVWLKIVLASLLMVLLDYFMERIAPIFDFWMFEGTEAPLENYITWFIVALFFQTILQLFRITGNNVFSLHLYLSQLFFFAYFSAYYSLN
ncbi:MAG: carotenoid biosynthesis protein [Bacteroidota bacterium]